MDEKDVTRFRQECLPEMNAGKGENAVLLFITERDFRRMGLQIMNWEMDGDVMIWDFGMRI